MKVLYITQTSLLEYLTKRFLKQSGNYSHWSDRVVTVSNLKQDMKKHGEKE